jgi:hypothetical protein
MRVGQLSINRWQKALRKKRVWWNCCIEIEARRTLSMALPSVGNRLISWRESRLIGIHTCCLSGGLGEGSTAPTTPRNQLLADVAQLANAAKKSAAGNSNCNQHAENGSVPHIATFCLPHRPL